MNSGSSILKWGINAVTRSTDILRRVLGSLSAEDIAELNQVAIRREYPGDAVICREGELEHTFYVIESGAVSVTRRLNDETDQVLGVLGDGQFFGEMGLLDDVPRAATIRTLTTSTLHPAPSNRKFMNETIYLNIQHPINNPDS